MFTFKYPIGNLNKFLDGFAKKLGTRVINNKVIIPSAIGSGYIRLMDLPNDLSALIMNFQLHTDMHLEQSKSTEEVYTLRFEQTDVPQSLTTNIDGEYIKDTRHLHNSVYMVYSLFDLGYIFTKNTSIKCMSIQMHKEWLGKYLKMEVYNEIVEQYIALKTASLNLEPLDAEYKRILNDIIEVNEEHPTHVTTIQNRIMALIEHFFTNLYEKRYQFRHRVKASTYDIEQIRKVEDYITRDISVPCPTITELSKVASISPTKLKQLFKEVYGMPVYKYYQHHRMQKAKAMLLSKRITIKEVGLSLGYNNLSNFAAAFRKEFNILPSDLFKS